MEVDAQEFPSQFHHMGVVTVWICLQHHGQVIQNYPLLVAVASSAKEQTLVIYIVGVGTKKKHSVGMDFDPNVEWFHAPGMIRGDVWLML